MSKMGCKSIEPKVVRPSHRSPIAPTEAIGVRKQLLYSLEQFERTRQHIYMERSKQASPSTSEKKW